MIRFAPLFIALSLLVFACSKDDGPDDVELSSENLITSFSLNANGDVFGGQINDVSNIITVETLNADISNIAPSIEVSPKATISPLPSTPQNFNNDVLYTVVAENGSRKNYRVSVSNYNQSDANLILSFKVEFDSFTANASIDNDNNTIYFEGGANDLSSIIPVIEISDNATITPSDSSLNFNEEITYTVTAESGSERVYTVTTNKARIDSVSNISGTFTNNPLFVYTGAEIAINGVYTFGDRDGAKIYLDDGTNTFDLEILNYSEYSFEAVYSTRMETEIPRSIPTNTYNVVFELNDVRVESNMMIDILAENSPIIESSNQNVYNRNDVLVFTGQNLPDMIAIPSNGNLFLVENSNNYDLTVNAERTELRVTLDYFQLFPSYYGREPSVKSITPLGPGRRAGKPFSVTFN